MKRFPRSLALGIVIVAVIVAMALIRPRLLYPLFYSGHPVVVDIDQDALVLHGSYPEFGRPGVDAYLKTLVDELIVQPATVNTADRPRAPGAVEVTMSYAVPYRTLRYAGVVMTVDVRSQGHTGRYMIARTYDLFRDRALTPADISPGPDGMRTLEVVVYDQLEGVEGFDPELAKTGLQPTEDSFRDFIGEADVVNFYLRPGQVAGPEQGTVIVRVSREDISH